MRAARVGDRPGLLVEVGTSWDDAGMHKQFAEVRLSAKGINDGRIHTIWNGTSHQRRFSQGSRRWRCTDREDKPLITNLNVEGQPSVDWPAELQRYLL
jgi:hypothetical protein